MSSKRNFDSTAENVKVQKRKTTDENHSVISSDAAEKLLNDLKHNDPVFQMHLSEKCPSITLSSPKLLETLIYPLSPESFKSTCFRQKAVHIRSNNSDRARDLSSNYMFDLDPKQIFEETSSDSVFLWIPPNPDSNSEGERYDEKALQSIDIQDPNTAYILHTSSNYASYCRAPPELEQPLVSRMLKDVGLGLGQYDPTGEKMTTLGRGEVETFIGTKGHLTDWHTDFQENFTIQLSGKKKWTLKQGTVKHPLRGTTPHYKSSEDVIENQIKAARLSNPDFQFGKQNLESNAFGDEVEIIMNAGDVLYFPAGMWHKVETLEYGVSINVSLMGSSYASLVCKTLEHVLLQKEEWREVICSKEDGGNDVVKKLRTLLNDLPSIVETFGLHGGAMGILPPVLRRPPNFVVESGEAVEIDEEVDEKIEEMDEESFSHDENGEKSSTGDNDDDGDGTDMGNIEDDEEIIDINDFELPEDLNCPPRPSGNVWRKNPLASLMSMKDVRSFYGNKTEISRECKDLFILNVNFAGNDMHESSVRVVLRDDSGHLQSIIEKTEIEIDKLIAELDGPPAALIYYGFLI